jgi:hypothetical protein
VDTYQHQEHKHPKNLAFLLLFLCPILIRTAKTIHIHYLVLQFIQKAVQLCFHSLTVFSWTGVCFSASILAALSKVRVAHDAATALITLILFGWELVASGTVLASLTVLEALLSMIRVTTTFIVVICHCALKMALPKVPEAR